MNRARRMFLQSTATLSAGLIAAAKALATGQNQQMQAMPGMPHSQHKMPAVKSGSSGPIATLPILRTPHSGEHALNSRAYRARSNDGSGERLTTRSHGWRFAEGGLGKRQVHRLSHRPRRRRSPS